MDLGGGGEDVRSAANRVGSVAACQHLRQLHLGGVG
jgi:hypothetical protein